MDLCPHMKTAAIAIPLAAALLAVSAAPAPAATRTLIVQAGPTARANVPMSVPLPPGAAAPARMSLDGKPLPCQVADGRLWWILDALDAGASRQYTVEFGAAGPAEKTVRIEKGPDDLAVSIAGKPFTRYVFRPKTIGRAVLRRPYFFPVYGPGQVTMTRPYPMVQENLPKNVATDHPHHTSLYVAHGAVNGVDNWSIGSRAGYIVHKGFETVADGPVMGLFRETLDWTTVEKKPVMAETRTIRIYALPDTARMIDFELIFQARYGKVVLGDTKEGGLCAVRTRPEFRADGRGRNGRVVNSEGLSGKAAWGKKATWVDTSGEVDGRRLGLALFDHPGNLRHPTTWHARTYGLITANPFGLSHFMRGQKKRGDYTIEAGKARTWRYRVYFHEGDEKRARVADRWADFADPPKATWK